MVEVGSSLLRGACSIIPAPTNGAFSPLERALLYLGTGKPQRSCGKDRIFSAQDVGYISLNSEPSCGVMLVGGIPRLRCRCRCRWP